MDGSNCKGNMNCRFHILYVDVDNVHNSNVKVVLEQPNHLFAVLIALLSFFIKCLSVMAAAETLLLYSLIYSLIFFIYFHYY